MLPVDNNESHKFLCKREQSSQTKCKAAIIAVVFEISSHITAISHDVITRIITRGIKLAHAGNIPVLHFTRASHDEIGNDNRLAHLRSAVAIHRIVPVQKEAIVGKTNFFNNFTREKPTLEAGNIHRSFFVEIKGRRSKRVIDA